MSAPAQPALRVARPDVSGWRVREGTEDAGRTYGIVRRGAAVLFVECPDSPSARVALRLPKALPVATEHDVLCALRDAYADGRTAGEDEGWTDGFDAGYDLGVRNLRRYVRKALVGLGLKPVWRVGGVTIAKRTKKSMSKHVRAEVGE